MAVNLLGVAATDFSREVPGKSVPAPPSSKTEGSTQPKQTAEDTTSFTAKTNNVPTLGKATAAAPTRQVRVEALKQAVKSAQYQLDSAKIAQSIANSDI